MTAEFGRSWTGMPGQALGQGIGVNATTAEPA